MNENKEALSLFQYKLKETTDLNDNSKTTEKGALKNFVEQEQKSSIINTGKFILEENETLKNKDAFGKVGKSHSSNTKKDGSLDNIPYQKLKEIKVYDTEEEFERNLPNTVTVLKTPFGSKVFLVGTAHFSEQSQNDVSFVIRNVKPNIVMVELCPARIHILNMDEKALLEETKNFNLSKINSIIKQNGYINGIFFILLLHMSAQLTKELGMAPGGEFRRAFSEIKNIPGCLINLGDRPINITLQRALKALSFWQTIKLVWRVIFTDSISIKEVEECKQRDLLEKLMAEMAGEFPAFSDVFVKERDLYLCHSLQVAALPISQDFQNQEHVKPLKVVGVVGIGHAAGIQANWGKVKPEDIPKILEIPPTGTGTRMLKFSIKYGLIGCTMCTIYKVVKPIFISLYY